MGALTVGRGTERRRRRRPADRRDGARQGRRSWSTTRSTAAPGSLTGGRFADGHRLLLPADRAHRRAAERAPAWSRRSSARSRRSSPSTTRTRRSRLANDTEFGLVGYVFTQRPRPRAAGQRALEIGMVGLNPGIVSNPAAPSAASSSPASAARAAASASTSSWTSSTKPSTSTNSNAVQPAARSVVTPVRQPPASPGANARHRWLHSRPAWRTLASLAQGLAHGGFTRAPLGARWLHSRAWGVSWCRLWGVGSRQSIAGDMVATFDDTLLTLDAWVVPRVGEQAARRLQCAMRFSGTPPGHRRADGASREGFGGLLASNCVMVTSS